MAAEGVRKRSTLRRRCGGHAGTSSPSASAAAAGSAALRGRPFATRSTATPTITPNLDFRATLTRMRSRSPLAAVYVYSACERIARGVAIGLSKPPSGFAPAGS